MSPSRAEPSESGGLGAWFGVRAREFIEARVSAEFALALLVAATTALVQRQIATVQLADPWGVWIPVYALPAAGAGAVWVAKRRRWGKAKVLAIAGSLPLVDVARSHGQGVMVRAFVRMTRSTGDVQASSWTSPVVSAAVASTLTVAGVTATEAALGLDTTYFSRGAVTDRFDVALTSDGTRIGPGTPGEGAGEIEVFGAVDVYRFEAEEASRFTLETLAIDGDSECRGEAVLIADLHDSEGRNLSPGTYSPLVGVDGCRNHEFTVAKGGVYEVRVFGPLDSTGTGTYEIALVVVE